ncbi:hypothetical protein CTAYLR_004493 [Chrysophaeum taylorii]|uniref:Uncharacterized protein n=1 Tax=Chrysophaeum taylorii TaxID=2483200 RepID=A0AAD7UB00_9STRA|nr:hypothetical protein CTAYLR_004493 [Chrysophaeum taylorii]
MDEEAGRLFDEGCELSSAGEFGRAIACFEASCKLAPDALTLCNLGVSYERTGQVESAINCYSRASRLEPWDPVPRVNLGDALVRESRFVEAANAYVDALRAAEKGEFLDEPWTTLNNLGVAYERTGDPVKAEACYKKALEVRPDYDTARSNYLRMVKIRKEPPKLPPKNDDPEEIAPFRGRLPEFIDDDDDDDDDFDASEISRSSPTGRQCATCSCGPGGFVWSWASLFNITHS